jgi:hypothetical protein
MVRCMAPSPPFVQIEGDAWSAVYLVHRSRWRSCGADASCGATAWSPATGWIATRAAEEPRTAGPRFVQGPRLRCVPRSRRSPGAGPVNRSEWSTRSPAPRRPARASKKPGARSGPRLGFAFGGATASRYPAMGTDLPRVPTPPGARPTSNPRYLVDICSNSSNCRVSRTDRSRARLRTLLPGARACQTAGLVGRRTMAAPMISAGATPAATTSRGARARRNPVPRPIELAASHRSIGSGSV